MSVFIFIYLFFLVDVVSLNKLEEYLNKVLISRFEAIRASILSAAVGINIVLIGPPGTALSLIHI